MALYCTLFIVLFYPTLHQLYHCLMHLQALQRATQDRACPALPEPISAFIGRMPQAPHSRLLAGGFFMQSGRRQSARKLAPDMQSKRRRKAWIHFAVDSSDPAHLQSLRLSSESLNRFRPKRACLSTRPMVPSLSPARQVASMQRLAWSVPEQRFWAPAWQIREPTRKVPLR